jgi:molecular chaperone GrpE (heat shock protein)
LKHDQEFTANNKLKNFKKNLQQRSTHFPKFGKEEFPTDFLLKIDQKVVFF